LSLNAGVDRNRLSYIGRPSAPGPGSSIREGSLRGTMKSPRLDVRSTCLVYQRQASTGR